jgi:hypothetical protein
MNPEIIRLQMKSQIKTPNGYPLVMCLYYELVDSVLPKAGYQSGEDADKVKASLWWVLGLKKLPEDMTTDQVTGLLESKKSNDDQTLLETVQTFLIQNEFISFVVSQAV